MFTVTARVVGRHLSPTTVAVCGGSYPVRPSELGVADQEGPGGGGSRFPEVFKSKACKSQAPVSES